jgi:hypothetical protein
MSILKQIFVFFLMCGLTLSLMRTCKKHFTEGECDGLEPKAELCLMLGGDSGLCAYKEDNKPRFNFKSEN